MYSFLDRILHKLSIDTLFTSFGLQINELGEENIGKKLPVGEFFKITPFRKFQKCYFWIYLDSTLSNLSIGTKNT